MHKIHCAATLLWLMTLAQSCGHFYDAMTLEQCCKYIAQSIYNITTL